MEDIYQNDLDIYNPQHYNYERIAMNDVTDPQ